MWQFMIYFPKTLGVVLGSSLSVFPANQMPLIARKAGAKLMYINLTPTLMDKYSTIRLLGRLGVILPNLVKEI